MIEFPSIRSKKVENENIEFYKHQLTLCTFTKTYVMSWYEHMTRVIEEGLMTRIYRTKVDGPKERPCTTWLYDERNIHNEKGMTNM